jgi:hypothetical protein
MSSPLISPWRISFLWLYACFLDLALNGTFPRIASKQQFREYLWELYSTRPDKLPYIAGFVDEFIETITGFFVAVLALHHTFPNKFVRKFVMKLCLDPQFSFLMIMDHFDWSYVTGQGFRLVLKPSPYQAFTFDSLRKLVLKEATESNIQLYGLDTVNSLCLNLYYEIKTKGRKSRMYEKVCNELQILIKAFLCKYLLHLNPDKYGGLTPSNLWKIIESLNISKKTKVQICDDSSGRDDMEQEQVNV